MNRVADKIIDSVWRAPLRFWVCTPKDCLDLSGREADDPALFCPVKAGQLPRIGRGLYDIPRIRELLKHLHRRSAFDMRPWVIR